MALNAMWVHGNTVRSEFVHDNLLQVSGTYWNGSNRNIPWSDVNGLPRGWGTTFRCKSSETGGLGGHTVGPLDVNDPFRYTLKGYWFHYSIPTPVIHAGRRSQLLRVFSLYDASPGIHIWCIHVWDGPNRIAALPSTSRPASLPTGRGGPGDLIEGVNMFTLPAPVSVNFSIGISMAVGFPNDGEITFVAGGADFDS